MTYNSFIPANDFNRFKQQDCNVVLNKALLDKNGFLPELDQLKQCLIWPEEQLQTDVIARAVINLFEDLDISSIRVPRSSRLIILFSCPDHSIELSRFKNSELFTWLSSHYVQIDLNGHTQISSNLTCDDIEIMQYNFLLNRISRSLQNSGWLNLDPADNTRFFLIPQDDFQSKSGATGKIFSCQLSIQIYSFKILEQKNISKKRKDSSNTSNYKVSIKVFDPKIHRIIRFRREHLIPDKENESINDSFFFRLFQDFGNGRNVIIQDIYSPYQANECIKANAKLDLKIDLVGMSSKLVSADTNNKTNKEDQSSSKLFTKEKRSALNVSSDFLSFQNLEEAVLFWKGYLGIKLEYDMDNDIPSWIRVKPGPIAMFVPFDFLALTFEEIESVDFPAPKKIKTENFYKNATLKLLHHTLGSIFTDKKLFNLENSLISESKPKIKNIDNNLPHIYDLDIQDMKHTLSSCLISHKQSNDIVHSIPKALYHKESTTTIFNSPTLEISPQKLNSCFEVSKLKKKKSICSISTNQNLLKETSAVSLKCKLKNLKIEDLKKWLRARNIPLSRTKLEMQKSAIKWMENSI